MNLIVSAPSGSGKTTLLHGLFEALPNIFGFSISATTRKPRENEVDGKDYYFISEQEFQEKIRNDAFLEYEQVYQGLYYGTLKSEIQRINLLGQKAVFDVDVKGGVNIKKTLTNQAYSIFIMPPDILTLEKRLLKRNTETKESLNKRLQRAEMEIEYSKYFDKVIVNDNLTKATQEFIDCIKQKVL